MKGRETQVCIARKITRSMKECTEEKVRIHSIGEAVRQCKPLFAVALTVMYNHKG